MSTVLTVARAQDDDDRQSTPILNPFVAKELLEAYEKTQDDRHREALDDLNRLLERRGDSMKPFDRASVLQIRGIAHVNLENFNNALRDFEEVLRLDALPEEQQAQMLFNVAQLYFQLENYTEAAKHLEQWLRDAEAPDANAYYLLASAYYYQEDYARARPNIERALELSNDANKRYYELANIVYSDLGLQEPRAGLLERMISRWPEEQSYWKQLAGLYAEMGDERQAFAILETAYHSGMIDAEDDIITLAQYYSLFNNPHRGAELLAGELAQGAVERNAKNLELLSMLWSQAREHDKAIPVLRQAARLSETGKLYYRFAQVLLADEQNEAAEKALEQALKQGGLDSKELADAWLLLGTARFNQAGPGDRDKRAEADQAFTRAQQFAATRRRASEWRRYISAINDTEARQVALEKQQSQALARSALERQITACRARQLSGAELGDECAELLQTENE